MASSSLTVPLSHTRGPLTVAMLSTTDMPLKLRKSWKVEERLATSFTSRETASLLVLLKMG